MRVEGEEWLGMLCGGMSGRFWVEVEMGVCAVNDVGKWMINGDEAWFVLQDWTRMGSAKIVCLAAVVLLAYGKLVSEMEVYGTPVRIGLKVSLRHFVALCKSVDYCSTGQ